MRGGIPDGIRKTSLPAARECLVDPGRFSMTVPHLAQLRELQEENARLKRMYADLALMHSALKDVVDRKL